MHMFSRPELVRVIGHMIEENELVYRRQLKEKLLRNGERAACNYRVMDARGRLLSTKEA